MNDLETSTKNPGRRINRPVIIGFLVLTLLALLGVVFIPWDVPVPNAPDLELKEAPVPAAENAFTYFAAAGKLQVSTFTAPDGSQQYFEDLLYKETPDGKPSWDPAFADEVILANAAAFAELEKGIARQHYQPPPSSDDMTFLNSLLGQKVSVQLLSLKSKRDHLAGDYAGAAEAGLLGLQMGLLATGNCNFLHGWLVGIACERMAIARLEQLTADPKTPESALRKILTALNQVNPQDVATGLKKATMGDYGWISNLSPAPLRKDWRLAVYPMSRKFCWIPYAYKERMNMNLLANHQRVLIANADLPYAKINLAFPGRPHMPMGIVENLVFYAKPNSLGTLFIIDMASQQPEILADKCRLQAYFAGLHLKTALRLYELKHGELPATLNALVPEYLPEIPQDPYDGQPLRYSKAEKKIWAIGADLIDDGGKKKKENAIMLYRGRGTDAVMSLDPRDPNPPPLKKEDKP